MAFCIADLTFSKDKEENKAESTVEELIPEIPNYDARWGLIDENDAEHIKLKLTPAWITRQFAKITVEKELINTTFLVLMAIMEARADVFQNPGHYGIYNRLKQYDINPANDAAIPLLSHTIACIDANSLYIRKKNVVIALKRIVHETIYLLHEHVSCSRWRNNTLMLDEWRDIEKYQTYWDRDEAAENMNRYLENETNYLIHIGILDKEKSDQLYHDDPEEHNHLVGRICKRYCILPLHVYLYCIRKNFENLFWLDLKDYI